MTCLLEGIVMLTGAIVGAVAAAVLVLIRELVRKPDACPECGEALPRPWLKPVTECPECGEELDTAPRRRGRRTGRADPRSRGRGVFVLALLFGLVGVALIAVFTPAALESRRVWQHQQRQVTARLAEIEGREARGDPASRAKAQELRDQFRRDAWNPGTYKEEFATRLLFVGGGVVLVFVSLGLSVLLRLTRRNTVLHRDERLGRFVSPA